MINLILAFFRWSHSHQKWSRGHKARGQGHKKTWGQGQGQPFRGQTLSRPRKDVLEAKAKDQGHKRKCSPKKSDQNFFQAISKKKVFANFPQGFWRFLTKFYWLKNCAVLGRGQGNFRRFVDFDAKAKDLKMCSWGLHLWYSQQAWSQKPCCFYWCFVGHDDQHHHTTSIRYRATTEAT